MAVAPGDRAWVFVMKSDTARSWAANQGYDDSVGLHYSYDSNVGNSRQVSVGDLVVIREDDFVAGWGFIEYIEVTPNSVKEITRCPVCRRTNFSRRKTVVPANKCSQCSHEFSDEEALRTLENVTAFRAYYQNTWTEAARPIHRQELESIIETRDTFNAIRPINRTSLTPFLEKVSGRDVDLLVDVDQTQLEIIIGGHVETIIRRRRGQRDFRFRMMERFGEVCAFSGSQPPQVLEAAHIQPFSQTGEHRVDGGLLLRRDLHSLFDANLVTVNPDSLTVEIAPRLRGFDTYRPLDHQPLHIPDGREPSFDLLRHHFERSKRIFAHN